MNFKKIFAPGWTWRDEDLSKIVQACPRIVKSKNAQLAANAAIFANEEAVLVERNKIDTKKVAEFRKKKKEEKKALKNIQLLAVGSCLASDLQLTLALTAKKTENGFLTAAELSLQIEWYSEQGIRDLNGNKFKSNAKKIKLVETPIICQAKYIELSQ